jgi:cytochrome c-type biogenesis protein CcmH
MFEFVVIVSVLTILALVFIVPTLLKTNCLPAENYDECNAEIARERLRGFNQSLASGEMSQADFDIAKQELETNLAIDLSAAPQIEKPIEDTSRSMAIVFVVLVPILAVVLYMQLGRPDAINAQPPAQVQTPVNEQQEMSMQDALAKLSSRLKEQPNDPQGWFMLARTYMAMNRYTEAAQAYEKTLQLVDENADMLIRYADALAMSNDGVLAGKPRQLIEKALSLNPQHQQGLWLAGVAAMDASEFKLALKYFLIVQPMLVSNAEALSTLHNMIARTEQNLNVDEISQAQAQAKKWVAAATVLKSVEIHLTVSLDDALKDKVNASDIVFIYAKAMNGPPMPLAAVKKTVAELPLTITLNDAMAMMPTMKLSSFDKVKVGAIISKAGVAGSSVGDLFGEMKNIDVKSAGQISVAINQIRK